MTELKDFNMSDLTFESLNIVNGYILSNILGGSFNIRMKVKNIIDSIIYLEFLPHQNVEYRKLLEIEEYTIDYFSSKSLELMGKHISRHLMENMFKSIIKLPSSLHELPYLKVLIRNKLETPVNPGSLVNVELVLDRVIFMNNYYYIVCIMNDLHVEMAGGGSSEDLSVSSYSDTDTSTSGSYSSEE